MRFLELTWRVYIQHGLQGKMADYHLERAKKHKGDDSKIKKNGDIMRRSSENGVKSGMIPKRKSRS